MQSACMGALMELVEQDSCVLYLTADSGEGGLDRLFCMNFPDHAFNFGIAEANMVAAAAGLASAGKIPFVYTAAPFLVYRSFEFIRNDVCLQNLNVKLLGSGSGITVSSLGPTHHTTEDVALLRSLPNLKILSPATPRQVTACMKEAYRHKGPVYIRLGMSKEQEYFGADYQLIPNANEIMRSGNDVSIYTTGSILHEVMNAAGLLEKVGIGANVVNVPTIKPFDDENVLRLAARTPVLVTVEEHTIYGGLGGVVAEIIAKNRLPARLLTIGLRDCFTAGYGTLPQLRKENGLDAQSICDQIMEAFK